MAGKSGPDIVENGLVLCLDAANDKSYPRSGTVWSSGWAGSFSNPTYSFDGNLSTSTFQSGTATYTFAGGGLSVSGTVRIYVTFGASSGQVSGLPNVIVVDGTDVSSKMAAANVYTTGVGAGWIDITSEVGSVFNTIVMTGTGGRSNPSIYAVEVNGQILIDAVAVTAWSDLSGNNNTGTLTNGPTFSAGNQGSIVFDGTNDYVTKTSWISPPTNTFTIGCWVKFSDNVNDRYLLSFGRDIGGSTGGLALFAYGFNAISDVLIFEFGSGIGRVSSGIVPSLNIWYYLTVTADVTNVKFYLNGELKNTSSQGSGAITSSPTLSIGSYVNGSGTPGTYFYAGNIAQVSIYNRSLTAAEVLQNYNATKSRFGR